MSGQLDQELSREDVLKSDAYEAFKGGKTTSDRPEAKADDAKGPDKAPEGSGVPVDAGKPAEPDGKAAGTGTKPRDETGKFAPAPEPFEGFNDLDPKVQKYFKNLQSSHNKLQNDYSAVAGRVQPLQREMQRLQQQLEAPKQAPGQGQKQVNDFLKSDKFKDYESRFPEDAQAIREGFQNVVDHFSSQLADSGKPLADDLAQVKAKLGEYEQERRNEAARKETDRLNEAHPDWKHIAGWVDDDGNDVSEPNARKWHPWFTAWQNGLPSSVRSSYDRLLAEASAESIGYVLTQFKRDVMAHEEASGQKRPDAPESDVAERRSEQLRDISPRPSRSGADQPLPHMNGGGGDRAAFLAQYYDKWKAGQKL